MKKKKKCKRVALLDKEGNIAEVYESAKEAGDDLGFSPTYINCVCAGSKPHAGGKKFIYVSDDFVWEEPKQTPKILSKEEKLEIINKCLEKVKPKENENKVSGWVAHLEKIKTAIKKKGSSSMVSNFLIPSIILGKNDYDIN